MGTVASIRTGCAPWYRYHETCGKPRGHPNGDHFFQFEDTRVDTADEQTGKQENEIKSSSLAVRRVRTRLTPLPRRGPFSSCFRRSFSQARGSQLLLYSKSPCIFEFRAGTPLQIVDERMAIKVNKFCIDDMNESFNGFIGLCVRSSHKKKGSRVCGSEGWGWRRAVDMQ